MSDIKSTAIPYAGYDYQTFHGISILLDWVNNPSLYRQVALEADTSQDDIPPAIDDIVCQREDGTFEYYQVKFTVDEEKYGLSWDWLVSKKGKGRSLIRKIYDGITKLEPAKIHTAQLVTNRSPDLVFDSCLRGKQVDCSKLSDEVKNKLLIELETEENIKRLFNFINFEHSQKNLLTLRIEIISKAFDINNSDSIYRLFDEVKYWAIHKNKPNEDGWIFLSDIKSILSPVRPNPLPQSFRIPNGYTPPSQEFHDSLINKVKSIDDNIFVLTGPPGRGKSTYLSYFVSELDNISVPYIRHHYYLSGDKTEDRFSHRAVQDDLKHQINLFHGGNDKGLSIQLNECAEKYKIEKKPFVVLLDGLDHVWRSNYGDSKPLDSLFNELFPPIENVVYIIGTQPIANAQLPASLFKYKKRKDWLELPEMTGNSTLAYLRGQLEEERLLLNCHEDRKEDELCESAKALPVIMGLNISATNWLHGLQVTILNYPSYSLEIHNKMPMLSGLIEP